jgi:hypothetical protein
MKQGMFFSCSKINGIESRQGSEEKEMGREKQLAD